MKIGVIGAGRLGISFALLCEEAGYDVIVSDIREDYVNDLNNKIINTEEPFVKDLLKQSKNLKATSDNCEVILNSDLIFTFVNTPSADSGNYDVNSIWKVIQNFFDVNKKNSVSGKSFIVGCTVNPRDCFTFQELLSLVDVDVFYNPEFIAQGSIVNDLRTADFVLIGGPKNKTTDNLQEIYTKIQNIPPKIMHMSLKSAEITKIAINCYLTTKISYANMIGQTLIKSGLEEEIDLVLNSIGSDSRIGNKFLKFGYGFGGPCLPRDNRSFGNYLSNICQTPYNLGVMTDNFNEEHCNFLIEYLSQKNSDRFPFYFDYISYKRGTDILEESHQYKVCLGLLERGYRVYITDNDFVISQVKNILTKKYGENVKFEVPTEEVFKVEL
jgi:UDPglucose 6-dehydrogenase